jgi:hypothetical protein
VGVRFYEPRLVKDELGRWSYDRLGSAGDIHHDTWSQGAGPERSSVLVTGARYDLAAGGQSERGRNIGPQRSHRVRCTPDPWKARRVEAGALDQT